MWSNIAKAILWLIGGLIGITVLALFVSMLIGIWRDLLEQFRDFKQRLRR